MEYGAVTLQEPQRFEFIVGGLEVYRKVSMVQKPTGIQSDPENLKCQGSSGDRMVSLRPPEKKQRPSHI